MLLGSYPFKFTRRLVLGTLEGGGGPEPLVQVLTLLGVFEQGTYLFV